MLLDDINISVYVCICINSFMHDLSVLIWQIITRSKNSHKADFAVQAARAALLAKGGMPPI